VETVIAWRREREVPFVRSVRQISERSRAFAPFPRLATSWARPLAAGANALPGRGLARTRIRRVSGL